MAPGFEIGALKNTEVTVTLRCKVAVCGEPTVGKTSLVSMYTSKGKTAPKTYNMTTSMEVVVAQVHVPDTTAVVELFLYDTPGSDLNKDSLASLWNGIYHAILVYDVSSQESYDACKLWLEELKKARIDRERPLKAVLVANKTDLPNQRHQVADDVAEVWATANGLEFFSISSMPPGKDVEGPFLALAKAFHKSYEEKVAAFQDACRNY